MLLNCSETRLEFWVLVHERNPTLVYIKTAKCAYVSMYRTDLAKSTWEKYLRSNLPSFFRNHKTVVLIPIRIQRSQNHKV